MRALLPLVVAIGLVGCLGDFSTGTRASDGAGPRRQLLGVNIDPQNPTADPSTDTLAALGATRVRFTLRAGDDLDEALATFDPIVDRYRAAGLSVLLILDGETLPLPDRPVVLAARGEWPTYVARFAERAGRIAARFEGRVDAYEIWNEEDLDDSLPGRHIDPAPYAALLGATFDAIHARAGARVLVGGLASGDAAYLDRMGEIRADAIATHPYLHWPGAGVPGGWYPLEDHVRAYAAYGLPLWFTEWGTSDEHLLEPLMRGFFAGFDGVGSVEEAYFFGWSDTQDPGFGLTTDGAQAKPGPWAAFHDASREGDVGSHPTTGGVRGTVRDASNGGVIHPDDPEHAAGITIYCGGQQVQLRSDGSYEIAGLAAGPWGISAVNNTNQTGWYQPWESTLTVVAGQTQRVDIDLVPR